MSAEGPRVLNRQIWFGPEERPLYGWLSVPADRRTRRGVIICPPLGEEGRLAHRTLRRLAESLAAAGLAGLRFDYDGTGDSAGRQEDPSRLTAWLASIEAARAELRRLGVTEVSAVGMRMGATLAALAAADEPFSDLVLWDPCATGTSFLREGEALYAFAGFERPTGETADAELVHTPGFQFSAETTAALRGVKLSDLPADATLADRVLLVQRDDRRLPARVRARFDGLGDRLTRMPALDQAELMDRPTHECRVPERSLTAVSAWVTSGATAKAQDGVLVLDTIDVPEERSVTVADGVRESSVHLGDVYGVLSELAWGAEGAPWVVLVNIANEHHIGPGRRWVDFARTWAAAGYRVLRIDQSGCGDAPTPDGVPDDLIYSPHWIDDMRSVVGELTGDGAPLCLIGVCSGSYSALEAALWDRVDAVVALSPRLTLFPAGRGTPAYTDVRRAAVLPNAPFSLLARQHPLVASWLWRGYRQGAVWHAPMRIPHRVARRGTQVLVATDHADGQHFTEVLGYRAVRRPPGLEFEVYDELDHALVTLGAQRLAFERVDRFLSAHLPAPKPAPVLGEAG